MPNSGFLSRASRFPRGFVSIVDFRNSEDIRRPERCPVLDLTTQPRYITECLVLLLSSDYQVFTSAERQGRGQDTWGEGIKLLELGIRTLHDQRRDHWPPPNINDYNERQLFLKLWQILLLDSRKDSLLKVSR